MDLRLGLYKIDKITAQLTSLQMPNHSFVFSSIQKEP